MLSCSHQTNSSQVSAERGPRKDLEKKLGGMLLRRELLQPGMQTLWGIKKKKKKSAGPGCSRRFLAVTFVGMMALQQGIIQGENGDLRSGGGR